MEQFEANTILQNYELAKALAKRLNAESKTREEVAGYSPAKLCLEADATLEEAQQISLLPVKVNVFEAEPEQHYPLFLTLVLFYLAWWEAHHDLSS